ASTYSCSVNGGAQVVSNSVTLVPGDNAVCTINNNDIAAHLIVIKHVVNNNGGAKVAGDFTTTITGVTTAAPSAAGVESPVVNYVPTRLASDLANTYSYSVNGEAQVVSNSVTIVPGDNEVCTINNNDIAAHLIVIKHVVNNNGGAKVAGDFTTTI